MIHHLSFWGDAALDALGVNLRLMVWNSFLAFIPLALSYWLFCGRGRRTVAWWIGFGTFIAFLPNAPYVLTDVIHLVDDIRYGYSIWIITLVLIPQYLIFMFAGIEAYVLSVINFGRYLKRRSLAQYVPLAELVIHALCAIGIYLGRFQRFNSWDILTQPDMLVISVVDDLLGKRPLMIVAITFVVITVVYWLLKQMTLALTAYWRKSRLDSSSA
ncbi:MAG: DUF1361 domain-containing protein [Leptolyngbyaceae cyanobacterium MO_188.B28]|nr:DUF1361 domain-containing protein [Leptolyngbyaceae cyanobacterium MO_188.B28]